MAGLELRRFIRDRANIFFVFIFPLLLVLVIGLQFGGSASQGTLAVVGPASELRTTIEDGLERTDVTHAEGNEAREMVARERAAAAVFVPEEAAGDYEGGRDVELTVIEGSSANAAITLQELRNALSHLGTTSGQIEALIAHGADEEEARTALDQAEQQVEASEVAATNVNDISQAFAGAEGFEVGAGGQVLLFVFLNSLAGAQDLIQSRRYGTVSRALAAPMRPSGVIGGTALGRYVIAVFQGLYIMAATALLFGVEWGNVLLSGLVLLCFAAVAAGAAMLLGSLLDSEAAASGAGIGGGLVLAGLGGSMMPLELFPDTLARIAHITPHAWAYEAFAAIQRRGAAISDIWLNVTVLIGMALVLVALGAWALRRAVARPL